MTATEHGMVSSHRPAGVAAWTLRAVWGWALAAALVTGLGSWLGGERIHKIYDVPGEMTSGQSQPPDVVARINRAQISKHAKEGFATFGLLGAAMGLSLGLAGGLARCNMRAALVAGVVGLVLAGAVGAYAGKISAQFVYQNIELYADSATHSLLVHGAICVAIGLAGGLAFGIGLGGGRTIIEVAVGGLIGALGATVVHELIGSLFFPAARTYQPIADTASARLVAQLLVAFFIAAGAAVLAGTRVRNPKGK